MLVGTLELSQMCFDLNLRHFIIFSLRPPYSAPYEITTTRISAYKEHEFCIFDAIFEFLVIIWVEYGYFKNVLGIFEN